MTWENKPVWTEGMFLRPQHFQQLERFVGAQLEARTSGLRSYGWGFETLEIDEGLLKMGKIGISRASGVFEDGTPFRIPGEAPLPPPLEIDSSIRDNVICLCLPLSRAGTPDVALEPKPTPEQRFEASGFEASDTVDGATSRAMLTVGKLALQIRPTDPFLNAYTSIPLVRVQECRADKSVVRDEKFVPTVVAHRASPRLEALLSEVSGMLNQRGEAVAARLAPGRNATAANILEYGTLMHVNGAQNALRQIQAMPVVHPADLYRELASLAGALATFTHPSKRPVELPLYDHRAIGPCYEALLAELRRSLNVIIDPPFELIDLVFNPGTATWNGVFPNAALFENRYFVLSAQSSAPTEQVRTYLPNLTKVGAPDDIGDMVNLGVGSIDVRARDEPRELPHLADTAYFDIITASPYWANVRQSQAVAIHVAAQIPDLALQLWAIKKPTP